MERTNSFFFCPKIEKITHKYVFFSVTKVGAQKFVFFLSLKLIKWAHKLVFFSVTKVENNYSQPWSFFPNLKVFFCLISTSPRARSAPGHRAHHDAIRHRGSHPIAGLCSLQEVLQQEPGERRSVPARASWWVYIYSV